MQNALHILLVDSRDIIHQTIADYLSDSGHSVDRAIDGVSALEAVKNCSYDLVFTDVLTLSTDDSSLMINILKARPAAAVIIISAYSYMRKVIELLKLGAMDYILKPIKLLELDAVLEKSIRFSSIIV